MCAKKQDLYQIDLNRNTAFCIGCGGSEIYVRNSHKRTEPLVLCIKNAQDIALHYIARRNE